MRGYIKTNAVENAILKKCREDMAYAREALTKYRQRVGRTTVTGHDRYEYMGGLPYQKIDTSLNTLSELCEQLNLARIKKILDRHIARLKCDFEALYNRDRKQVCDARDAEHKARLAEIRGH